MLVEVYQNEQILSLLSLKSKNVLYFEDITTRFDNFIDIQTI